MNRSDLDWAYVGQYTLRPALCALIAVCTLSVAMWLHDKEQQLFAALDADHAAVHRDYDALVRQRRVVDRYHRRYQRFHELGFIGRESRLDWVETLRTTAAELSMPRITYAIDPQLRVVAPVNSVLNDEDIQVRVSKLQLEMGLVHEVDLLRFFDALQSKAPGLIKVDNCDLVNHSDSGNRAESNLSATCSVQIFSVITSDVGMEAV